MIAPVLLSILGAAAGVAAADTFEAVDFNVTDSLLSLGVDVTQLPELATFEERSSFDERSSNFQCAAAVSCPSISSPA